MNRDKLIYEIMNYSQEVHLCKDQWATMINTDHIDAIIDLVEKQNGWISPDLKESGKTVLCWYENSYAKKRVVRAVYYGKYEFEDGFGEEPEDWYDVKDGIYYVPAGWYEYNEGSEVQMLISEEIKGWQPLPLPPITEEEK